MYRKHIVAQTVGFENISLDLMYGLPGQTMELLQDSVQQAVATGVQHISIYGLQLEEGTVKSRIFRARKKLCDILSKKGNLSGDGASKKQKEGGRDVHAL